MVAPWIKIGHGPRKKAPVGIQVAAPPVKKVAEETRVAVPLPPAPLEEAVSPVVVEKVIEESIDLNKLRKTELITMAVARGIDASGCTKAQLIELLNS